MKIDDLIIFFEFEAILIECIRIKKLVIQSKSMRNENKQVNEIMCFDRL